MRVEAGREGRSEVDAVGAERSPGSIDAAGEAAGAARRTKHSSGSRSRRYGQPRCLGSGTWAGTTSTSAGRDCPQLVARELDGDAPAIMGTRGAAEVRGRGRRRRLIVNGDGRRCLQLLFGTRRTRLTRSSAPGDARRSGAVWKPENQRSRGTLTIRNSEAAQLLNSPDFVHASYISR
jgi:hypothetical protein